MIQIRRREDRGHFNHGWLDTYHAFSFADYYDPAHMGFRQLRVLNEDRVRPGRGFPPHAHREMEILTFVLEGALEHKDSLGNGSTIRPGDVQRMTAGRGVTHSESNPSKDEPVHFLQVWVLPNTRALPPSYEQKAFPAEARSGRLLRVVSPDGRSDSVKIHQDVSVYAAVLKPAQQVNHDLAHGRFAWVQVARGSVTVNATSLRQGDGASISGEHNLAIAALEPADLLLFDLA